MVCSVVRSVPYQTNQAGIRTSQQCYTALWKPIVSMTLYLFLPGHHDALTLAPDIENNQSSVPLSYPHRFRTQSAYSKATWLLTSERVYRTWYDQGQPHVRDRLHSGPTPPDACLQASAGVTQILSLVDVTGTGGFTPPFSCHCISMRSVRKDCRSVVTDVQFWRAQASDIVVAQWQTGLEIVHVLTEV